MKKKKLAFAIAAAFAASPVAAEEWSVSDTGAAIAGIGALVGVVGFLAASSQEEEADDCRLLNSSGGVLACTNQSELDDEVDTFETVGIVGLAGVGIGGIMYLSDTAAAAGFTGIKSVMDRHIHSIRYTADKENLMKLSYHSPDVSGMVLSYSGIKGFGLSKEWTF